MCGNHPNLGAVRGFDGRWTDTCDVLFSARALRVVQYSAEKSKFNKDRGLHKLQPRRKVARSKKPENGVGTYRTRTRRHADQMETEGMTA